MIEEKLSAAFIIVLNLSIVEFYYIKHNSTPKEVPLAVKCKITKCKCNDRRGKMRNITGTMYSYSFLCNRKLWLFSRNIEMEHNSQNVEIGKIIYDSSFSRHNKHVMIDNFINVDFIEDGIVYEVKKSSKGREMAINQIKYYLYILRKKGVDCPKGILSIPEEKKREEVFLTEEDVAFIEARLKEIETLINSPTIPEAIRIKQCRSCAYFDLCYV